MAIAPIISDTPAFEDASKLDKKIPKGLLMKYQNQWYILKAGLEWKANYLFGGGRYGVKTEIVSHTAEGVLAKATFIFKDGDTWIELFNNYGEASKANVSNPMMHKYMLHLAITRAECRVLRMATACGYASIEEMDLGTAEKAIPAGEHDNDPATPAQIKTLNQLKNSDEEIPDLTQGRAKELIAQYAKAGK